MVQELEARRLATDGLVQKPVDLEQLMSAIRRACGREWTVADHGSREYQD
jgi:hypothetical protein